MKSDVRTCLALRLVSRLYVHVVDEIIVKVFESRLVKAAAYLIGKYTDVGYDDIRATMILSGDMFYNVLWRMPAVKHMDFRDAFITPTRLDYSNSVFVKAVNDTSYERIHRPHYAQYTRGCLTIPDCKNIIIKKVIMNNENRSYVVSRLVRFGYVSMACDDNYNLEKWSNNRE